MVLVDIGNTHFHIFENGRIYDSKIPLKFFDDIYYISVNETKEKAFLTLNPKAVNLKKFVEFDTSYEGLGIDRVMACITIQDGLVIDAGSAVTIDVMHQGVHLGGLIMPGISEFKKSFSKISKKLDVEFAEIEPNKLPQNTKEAITYGSVGSILCMIEKLRKNKKIYLTGGDGKFLSRYVDGIFIKDLVFRGMLKVVKSCLG